MHETDIPTNVGPNTGLGPLFSAEQILLQDTNKGLSLWLATRQGARRESTARVIEILKAHREEGGLRA